MIHMLGLTFALGSRVALAAAAVLCAVMALRTALEDRVLQEELEGYADYASGCGSGSCLACGDGLGRRLHEGRV